MSPAEQKQHAHELVNRLDAGQLDAVVRLMEVMTDPVAHGLGNAPIEHEPASQEEIRDLETAREWLEIHDPISHEKVLAAIGLTPDAFRRIVCAPLESN